MSKKYLIIDSFVDEPACLGVPPFISPYPRYISGALICAGVYQDNIKYITIDSVRNNDYKIIETYEIIFIIGGAIVPGKYLGSRIGTQTEIRKIIEENKRLNFALGGMISQIIDDDNLSNLISIKGDIEKFAYYYTKGEITDSKRDYKDIARWAPLGSSIVKEHPDYPDVICEIETSRGCPRTAHCSFCSESITNSLEFREEDDILNEIDELIKDGVSRFRLGRQADILAYKTKFSEFRQGFPKPEIAPIKNILTHLRAERESGQIKILNIDNANPGTIHNFPDESSKILEYISDAVTPGETLALGIESLDPNVINMNNLKVNRDGFINVIKIINSIGSKRIEGIPCLLPGINLIHGLLGESTDTFKINYQTLIEIKDSDLLIKRINIRKALPFPGTLLYKSNRVVSKKIINRYEYYKERIRKEIDNFMLKQIYPVGTILKDTLVEDTRFDYSYAKQIASYSITAKIPVLLEKRKFLDVIVAGHRERSVIALPLPISINTLPEKAIDTIPGVDKRGAANIILNRPFKDITHLKDIAPNIDKSIYKNIII